MKKFICLLCSATALGAVDLLEVGVAKNQLVFSAPVSYVRTTSSEVFQSTSQVSLSLVAQREEILWFVGERLVGYLCWGEERPANRFWLEEATRQNLWSGGCIQRPLSAINLERLLLRPVCFNVAAKNASCYYWATAPLPGQEQVKLPRVLNWQLVQEYNLASQIVLIRESDGTALKERDLKKLKRGLYFLELHNSALLPFWSEP